MLAHKTHKPNRLEGYDYGSEGVYFLTVCTDNRRNYLSRIVARGILDAPETELTPCGRVVEEALLHLDRAWGSIKVLKYVIMLNHIHILLQKMLKLLNFKKNTKIYLLILKQKMYILLQAVLWLSETQACLLI